MKRPAIENSNGSASKPRRAKKKIEWDEEDEVEFDESFDDYEESEEDQEDEE